MHFLGNLSFRSTFFTVFHKISGLVIPDYPQDPLEIWKMSILFIIS